MKNTAIKILIIVIIAAAIIGGLVFAANRFLNINLIDTLISRFNIQNNTEQEEDLIPLEVQANITDKRILEATTSTILISNKEITPENEEKFKLIKLKEEDGKFYYVLEIYNIGIGDATITVGVKDSGGQTDSLTLKITRDNYNLPFGLREVEDWEGSAYILDGDDLLAPLNKGHKVVNDYEPEDLVTLFDDKNLLVQSETMTLRKDAAEYLSIMLKNLKDETGKVVLIASAYRSFNNQLTNYTESLRTSGQDATDKIIARPGFSEHQLGTAIDFQTFESGYTFTNNFDTSEAGNWIKENAHKYGFVQSYPEGKEDVTGYSYEAWHYRYIGVENAIELKESGLTLKEWLESRGI